MMAECIKRCRDCTDTCTICARMARNSDLHAQLYSVCAEASRSVEQRKLYPYRGLVNRDQVHRVYLDELGYGIHSG